MPIYLNIYFLLCSTIVCAFSVTTVEMNVGNQYFFSCPLTYHAFSRYDYISQFTLSTKNKLDIAQLPPFSGDTELIMDIKSFDNNLTVSCIIITAATMWKKRTLYKFSTEVTTRTYKSVETPDVHYYHEGDRYYFECAHSVAADITWIKVDGNNTIQAANHISTSRLIEPFNLTAADNDTKLFCFYFYCVPSTGLNKQCTRIVLKSVTLRVNVDITTPIPHCSNILLSVCFGIAIVWIMILIFIIWILVRKLARLSDRSVPQTAAGLEDRTLYENQDFNMQYADLDLDQTTTTNEQLSATNGTVYSEVKN